MRIAYIEGFVENGKMDYYVDFLEVDKETETEVFVKNHKRELEPRNNVLYKDLNMEMASKGYASLNLPCWVTVEFYETSSAVYVWEHDIEKGKVLVKEALLQQIERFIERYDALKHAVLSEK